MKRKINHSLSILIVLLFLISGCKPADDSGSDNSAPEFTKDIGWAMENIDTTYWTKDDPGSTMSATMFFNVWVYLSDADGTSDITNVTVTDPEGFYWVLRDTAAGTDLYDSDGGYFGGYRRHYSSTNPHKKLIGDYTVAAKDSAGNEVSKIRSFYEPGQSSATSTEFLYSEGYAGSIANGVKMIQRASTVSAVKDTTNDTVELSFTVNDSNVYDGYLWFYDTSASVNYIGSTDRLKGINGGSLLTNDSTNDISIELTDMNFESGKTFADIAGFHLVLTDGAQYSSTSWDNRSISAYDTF